MGHTHLHSNLHFASLLTVGHQLTITGLVGHVAHEDTVGELFNNNSFLIGRHMTLRWMDGWMEMNVD